MDADELEAAVNRWSEAGLIDRETAEAIRAHEADRDGSSSFIGDRLTGILAIVGALLIGVGILTAIAAAWDGLGDAIRTVLLLAAPLLAAVSGLTLDRQAYPRAGAGLWILAALLCGPCLFLLGDMYAPASDPAWFLLGWGAIAVPMGQAFRSRIPTGLGLGVLLLAVAMFDPGNAGAFAASALGALVIAAGGRRTDYLGETYRVVGLAPTVLTLLIVVLDGGPFVAADMYPTGGLIGAFVLGAVAVGVTAWRYRVGDVAPAVVVLVSVPVLAGASGIGVLRLVDVLPELAWLLLAQLLLLATLLAIVILALAVRSRWMINLVAGAFLLQILTLFVTFTDDLSGPVALIATGVAILAVALGLERGRRRLLGRIDSGE